MYYHIFKTAVVGDFSSVCKWKMYFYLNKTHLNILSPFYLLQFCLNDFTHRRERFRLARSLSLLLFRGCTMCTNYHFIFLVQSMTGLFVNISTVIVSESTQKSPFSFCYSMAHLLAPYAGCKNRC